MARQLSLCLCLALSIAKGASATPVTPLDYQAFLRDFGPVVSYRFEHDYLDPRFPAYPGAKTGAISSGVWYDGTTYLYAQLVQPWTRMNLFYSTEFEVKGFTGVAGWNFENAARFGGTGTAADFHIEYVGRRLYWIAQAEGAFGEWDSEPIYFYFTSTLPPTIKNYSLFTLRPLVYSSAANDLGIAHGLAPVPEPVSIALFGSGLVGLYALRRRRMPKR